MAREMEAGCVVKGTGMVRVQASVTRKKPRSLWNIGLLCSSISLGLVCVSMPATDRRVSRGFVSVEMKVRWWRVELTRMGERRGERGGKMMMMMMMMKGEWVGFTWKEFDVEGKKRQHQ
jgi:hypothetical protein